MLPLEIGIIAIICLKHPLFTKKKRGPEWSSISCGPLLALMIAQGLEPVSWIPFTLSTAPPIRPSPITAAPNTGCHRHLCTGHCHGCHDRLSCYCQLGPPERLLEAMAHTALSVPALGSNSGSALTSCEALSEFPNHNLP